MYYIKYNNPIKYLLFYNNYSLEYINNHTVISMKII